MFENAMDGIIICTADGTIIAANPAFVAMHGYAVEEILNMNVTKLDTPESARLAPERLRKLSAGEAFIIEVEHYCKNGRTILLEVSSTQIVLDNAVLLIGFHRNITDRRRMEEERIQKISEERAMTSLLMEIHDGIGGIMTNIKMLAELKQSAVLEKDIAMRLASIAELSRDGVAEIRNIMYGLDKGEMFWQSVVAELRSEGSKLLEPHRIALTVTSYLKDGSPDPSSKICLQLFKIYREAIMNVIKHAKATRVKVDLQIDGDRLVLNVQDNGRGIPENALIRRSGRGIGNMIRRAEALQGKTTITGDAGTRITIEIPLAVNAASGRS
jgi:PAS domain S-box-containing protein